MRIDGFPILVALLVAVVQEPGAGRYPDMPAGRPPTVDVPAAVAATGADMQPYRERIVGVGIGAEGGELHLDMTPVPGGEFLMGGAETTPPAHPATFPPPRPRSEDGRGELESPQRRVRVSPFWMATHETTWDLYRVFMFDTDRGGEEPGAPWVDAVSRPTPPYRPMDFGMGVEGFPAISMTQFAARQFTRWLSMKTGRFYRLPSEAEWEYACRAGAGTAWSFGDDIGDDAAPDGAKHDDAGPASAEQDDAKEDDAGPDAPEADDLAAIDRFAWYAGNSGRRYHEVARLEPNAWGLFDLQGNVAEWTLDAYARYERGRSHDRESRHDQNADDPGGAQVSHLRDQDPRGHSGERDLLVDPIAWPEKEYPRSVRGGSWQDEPAALRCAARRGSSPAWKRMDPQIPQSVWYHTNARFLGFRVVRPLVEPPLEEQERYWAADVDSVRRIVERQRRGERD